MLLGIDISKEIQCLPYAGPFFLKKKHTKEDRGGDADPKKFYEQTCNLSQTLYGYDFRFFNRPGVAGAVL